jgi:5'-3' exonuclease
MKMLTDSDAVAFLAASAIEDTFFDVVEGVSPVVSGLGTVAEARAVILKSDNPNLEIKLRQVEKAFPVYTKTFKQMIANLMEDTDSDDFRLFIERPKSKCFRYDIATLKPYKGQRRDNPLTARPLALDKLKDWIIRTRLNGRSAVAVDFIESDDALCIAQARNRKAGIDCIIVANDKDILQSQGQHFRIHRDHRDFVEVSGYGTLYLEGEQGKEKLRGTGSKFFFSQVLTGDTTDNYPGLPKCGVQGAFKLLDPTTTYQEGLEAVTEAYQKVYKDNWKAMLEEQGRLAWMLKEPLRRDLSNLWSVEKIYD